MSFGLRFSDIYITIDESRQIKNRDRKTEKKLLKTFSLEEIELLSSLAIKQNSLIGSLYLTRQDIERLRKAHLTKWRMTRKNIESDSHLKEKLDTLKNLLNKTSEELERI